jgi:hypothetical protein
VSRIQVHHGLSSISQEKIWFAMPEARVAALAFRVGQRYRL